jgi:hypothetical protein
MHFRAGHLLPLVAAACSLSAADQLALWDFDEAPVSGTTFNADQEYVYGVPTLTIAHQDIDANGKAGNNYTDALEVYQDSPDANDAIAWNDIRGSGDDGEVVISIDTRDYRDLSISFEYKYNNNNDGSSDLMELLYSSNGGGSYTKFGGSFTVIDDDAWHSKSFDLSSIGAIDNDADVRFKIRIDGSASGPDEVNNEIRFDNFEVTGENYRGNAAAPEIKVDASTTPYLSLFEDPVGFVNGTIGDPTDPAATVGIIFNVDDAAGDAGVSLSAIISDTTVVTQTGLDVDFLTASTRRLRITPTGVGSTRITVIATDASGLTDFYVIEYAASAASSTPDRTRFHTIRSDASTGVDIGGNYMWVADDEDQVLRLFDRQNSGWRVKGLNFNAALGLSVGDEADLEASAKSGGVVYWMGSHGNDRSGSAAPTRSVIFKTTLSGAGAASTLAYNGRYNSFRSDVIQWDTTNGHGLGANYLGLAAGSIGIPERVDGFNIEGLAMMPSSTSGAYVGFRAPLVSEGGIDKALIVPVTNFSSVATGSAPVFGAPIRLDLGGRGIRSVTRNANNDYLIVAGPPANTGSFALYLWDGSAGSNPVLLPTDIHARATEADASPEGVVGLNDDLSACTMVQILMDGGSGDFYNSGIENKDVPVDRWKKFRTDVIEIPPQGDTFTVTNTNDDGFGSLRRAIECANVTAGEQEIVFSLGGGSHTIELLSQIEITDDLTVSGPSDLSLTLSGGSSNRIFDVSANADLNQLRFENGKEVDGGALRFTAGKSLLRQCEVKACTATGRGGAVFIGAAELTVRNSAFILNEADGNGGAINANAGSVLHLTQSTVSANRSGDNGGGVFAVNNTVRIINSTITGNRCDADRSGSGNGGGIRRGGGSAVVSVGNTVIAGNIDGGGDDHPDISGSFTSLGSNMIGKSDGGTGFVNKVGGDLVGVIGAPFDPLLSGLISPAGLASHHEPLIGSPLVEAGDEALLKDPAWAGIMPTMDQRDGNRVANQQVDVGAVEFIPYKVTLVDLDALGGESPDNNRTVSARFTRDRAGPALSIPFSVLTGTFRASPGDVSFSSSRVNFAIGGTQFDLVATPVDDAIVEGQEILAIYLPPGAFHLTNGTGLAYLTINDNDFAVTDFGDSGPGTLREAIGLLNATDGGTVIFNTAGSSAVPEPRTITLRNPLNISSDIEIAGPGDNGAGVTLRGSGNALMIIDGDAQALLRNLTLTGGSASNGSAISLGGTSGAVVESCTLHGNEARGPGGAIYLKTTGSLVLRNSTITNNIAGDEGGAIHVGGGSVSVEHSTITGNTSGKTGGGLFAAGGTLSLRNSIVAENVSHDKSGAPDLAGPIKSHGGNLIGTAEGNSGPSAAFPPGAPNASGDWVGKFNDRLAPGLGPLQQNGGPTATRSPGYGSMALDNALPPVGLTTDQRGLTRATSPDIGAVEHQLLSYAYWLAFSFPPDPDATALYAPDLDWDGDRVSNGLERLFGTDPLDPRSCFHVDATLTGNDLTMVFPWDFTVGAAEFQVEWNADLGSTWSSNGVVIDRLDPAAGAFHPQARARVPRGPVDTFPQQFGRIHYQP